MDIGPEGVSISSPIASPTIAIVGMNISLNCSIYITPYPLPKNVSYPTFQWFFGPENASIPSNVILSNNSQNGTYTSTLQFAPLQVSHAGIYTCRLRGNHRLTAVTTLNLMRKLLYI